MKNTEKSNPEYVSPCASVIDVRLACVLMISGHESDPIGYEDSDLG